MAIHRPTIMFIFGVTWFSLLRFIKYNSIIFPAILSLKRIRSFTAIFNPSLNARWKLLRERNRFLFATVLERARVVIYSTSLDFEEEISTATMIGDNRRRGTTSRFPWSFFFQIFTNFLAESKRFHGIFPSNLVLIFTLTRAYLLFI